MFFRYNLGYTVGYKFGYMVAYMFEYIFGYNLGYNVGCNVGCNLGYWLICRLLEGISLSSQSISEPSVWQRLGVRFACASVCDPLPETKTTKTKNKKKL